MRLPTVRRGPWGDLSPPFPPLPPFPPTPSSLQAGLHLCDYLLLGEGCEAATERAAELLDLNLGQVDAIAQPEGEAAAIVGPATTTGAGRGGRTEPGRGATAGGGDVSAAGAAKYGSVRTAGAVKAAGELTEASTGEDAATGSCAATGVAAAAAAAVLAAGIAFMLDLPRLV